MPFLRILLLAVGAAMGYGIVHDQITARICLEYFTIGHPPVFAANSPTALGFGWGVIATWWMGVFLGTPLAWVARRAGPARISARQLVRPVLGLLGCMALSAATAGFVAHELAASGRLQLDASWAAVLPPAAHTGFLVDSWAHLASYLSGGLGGVVLVFWVWRKRRASQRQLAAAAAADLKMNAKKIRLFVKPWCGWCDEAKDWLDDRGIAYEELDVTADATARREMRELSGQTLAPTIDVDGEILADFDTDQLEVFWQRLTAGERGK